MNIRELAVMALQRRLDIALGFDTQGDFSGAEFIFDDDGGVLVGGEDQSIERGSRTDR